MNGAAPETSFLVEPIFGDAEIADLFGSHALARTMLRVEAALARAQAGLGVIPEATAAAIEQATETLLVPHDSLAAGVAAAGVPVPALVASLREAVGQPHADWVHWGATSQDIVDTASVLQYRAALDGLVARLTALIDALAAQSAAEARTPMAARTRGQIATPITAGLRIAHWAQPLIALEAEAAGLRTGVGAVQFGGASGSLSALGSTGPAVADALADALDLDGQPAWHTDRSRLRALAGWTARLVGGLAKMAGDFAIMARSEIAEARSGPGGGSSTMPHKANPVTAEAILSAHLAALGCEAGLSAAAVHAEERDGGRWAVEWLFLPRLCVLAGAALTHAHRLVGGLDIQHGAAAATLANHPQAMAEAAVFALAPQVGRAAAQALVAEALVDPDRGFAAALAARAPDADWARILDPSSASDASAAAAKRIFEARKAP